MDSFSFDPELEANVKAMSNEQLYQSLKSLVPNSGPVTTTTRRVSEKKLMKLIMKGGGEEIRMISDPPQTTLDAEKEELKMQQEKLIEQQQKLQNLFQQQQHQQKELERARNEQFEKVEQLLKQKENEMSMRKEDNTRRSEDIRFNTPPQKPLFATLPDSVEVTRHRKNISLKENYFNDSLLSTSSSFELKRKPLRDDKREKEECLQKMNIEEVTNISTFKILLPVGTVILLICLIYYFLDSHTPINIETD